MMIIIVAKEDIDIFEMDDFCMTVVLDRPREHESEQS